MNERVADAACQLFRQSSTSSATRLRQRQPRRVKARRANLAVEDDVGDGGRGHGMGWDGMGWHGTRYQAQAALMREGRTRERRGSRWHQWLADPCTHSPSRRVNKTRRWIAGGSPTTALVQSGLAKAVRGRDWLRLDMQAVNDKRRQEASCCGSPIWPHDMWEVCRTAYKLLPRVIVTPGRALGGVGRWGGCTASSDPPLWPCSKRRRTPRSRYPMDRANKVSFSKLPRRTRNFQTRAIDADSCHRPAAARSSDRHLMPCDGRTCE